MTGPAYLPYLILGANVLIILAVLSGLGAALRRANWPERGRSVVVCGTAAVIVGWFAVTVVLAAFGVYRAVPDRMPRIQFGLLLPIVVGALLIWRLPLVSRLVDAVPQSW